MIEPRMEFERDFAQRFEAYLDDGLGALDPKEAARAAIEHQPMATGPLRMATLAAATVLAAALVTVLVVKLLPTILPPAAVTIPPDSAPPAVVLDAYLRALQAGDCRTVSQLTNPLVLNKEYVDLCAVTRVTAFSILGDPVVVDPDTVRLRATITITGTANGILPGEITETFFVQRQLSGAWRIIGGYLAVPPSLLPPFPTPPTQ